MDSKNDWQPAICPICGTPIDLCEQLDDKMIFACNSERCWASFIYVYYEEALPKEHGEQLTLDLRDLGEKSYDQ